MSKKLKYRPKHKKPPRMSYRMYMGSAYWRRRKQVYFSQHGKRCAVCGDKEGVTLHHNRYDVRFGDEPDDALTPLCPRHHNQFHKNHDLKRNMHAATLEYTAVMKQLAASSIDDLSWI